MRCSGGLSSLGLAETVRRVHARDASRTFARATAILEKETKEARSRWRAVVSFTLVPTGLVVLLKKLTADILVTMSSCLCLLRIGLTRSRRPLNDPDASRELDFLCLHGERTFRK